MAIRFMHSVLCAAILACATLTHGFTTVGRPVVTPATLTNQQQHQQQNRRLSTTSLSAKKTTLTDETTWRFRIVLNGIPTEKGRKVDEQMFVVEAQFCEDVDYEPPQGSVKQILPADADSEGSTILKISNGRWKLSEDPTERKDGLWVWGLFKEPLYPFLLLQMQTDRIPIPGEEEDYIKPLGLYAQIDHSRDDDLGVVLKVATLNVRETESIKADPFGAAKVEIYEENQVGKITIQPIVEDSQVAKQESA